MTPHDGAVLLAVDPSSTRIGYAVLTGDRIRESGVIRPERPTAGAVERVVSMLDDLQEVIDELPINAVAVVEEPQDRWRGRSSKATAVVHDAYGMVLWCVVSNMGLARVRTVKASQWKRNRSKAVQKLLAAGVGYDADRDRGGDAADAIGLGRWAVQNRVIEVLSSISRAT